MSASRKALFISVAWLFLGILAYAAWRLVLPAVQHGAWWGYLLAFVFSLVGASFSAAAVTMTRDLLAGRYL